ncbi:hypothetical protein [Alkalihalobacillus deserti]|uniref:hypothetical protein n=1 Tax=Alkalihalobacillus deserti TaxID=2879466 RepID=UPI001D13CEC7|nr:hypothetical protein [Alkalihalobacillus deserti]
MRHIKNNRFYQLWEERKYKEALEQPVEGTSTKKERISALLFGSDKERNTTLAVGGISVGDFLYDYIRIDPHVVEAIDFARSDQIDSIFAFSEFSKGIDPNSVENISQMQGYVAEKMLAMELTAKGHEVSFPTASNEPGWDILVDGEQFQVKNLSDPSGIYEHLSKYPDIPVYINADLAHHFEGNSSVYIAENIHHQEIVQMTKEHIVLGQELQDFEIPLITALVSTVVNVKGLVKKESDIKHTISNIVTDTVTRSVGGYVGQYSGAIAGGLLFGPAGVIVMSGAGAFVGVAQGGKVAGMIKKMAAKEEVTRFRKDLTQLIDQAITEIPSKLERRNQQWLTTRLQLLLRNAPGDLVDSFEAKYQDEQEYLKNKRKEFNTLKANLENMSHQDAYCETLAQISNTGIHPSKYQRALKKVNESLETLLKKLKKMGLG